MNRPLISVIIPTYNEQRDIEACLNSLSQQTYQPLEIIVVDDGSTDRTLNLLKGRKGIKRIKNTHQGPGAARNRGAKKAKGEILVFVDADMTFEKRFIDRLTEPIRENRVIGTFSKEEYVANPQNRWSLAWSIDRGFLRGRMHPPNYPDTQRVFRAIRKDKFRQVGGFDTKLGYTDDWSLAKKLGALAHQAPGAVFYHRNPETLSEVFTQAKWAAMRPYKLGPLGVALALLRASLPITFIVAAVRAIRHKAPFYFLAKGIIDLATSVGILLMVARKKRVK